MDYRDTLAWQRVKESSVVMSGTQADPIVGTNPQRVGIAFSITAGTAVFISTVPTNYPNASGFVLGTADRRVILSHSEHGALVQSAWYCWGSAGDAVCCVELIMDNPPRQIITREE